MDQPTGAPALSPEKSAVDSDALVVEKNPRNTLRIPFLRQVFPEAKIIHIIRDGRDVACSLSPGVAGDQWNHLKPPDWQELHARHTGLDRAAMLWRSVMQIALRDLGNVLHLEVRYENLVQHPTAEARRVLRYLDLDESPEVLGFAQKIQNQTASSYHARHQSRWYRDDHETRVGRWEQNLTEPQQHRLNSLLAPMLGQLGYEIPINADFAGVANSMQCPL